MVFFQFVSIVVLASLIFPHFWVFLTCTRVGLFTLFYIIGSTGLVEFNWISQEMMTYTEYPALGCGIILLLFQWRDVLEKRITPPRSF